MGDPTSHEAQIEALTAERDSLKAALKSVTAADDKIQNYAAAEIRLLRAEVAKLCWERDDLDKQHKRVFEDRARLREALAGATKQAVSALITVHDILRVFVRRGIPGVAGDLAEADERVLAALAALAQEKECEQYTDSTARKVVVDYNTSTQRANVEPNAYDVEARGLLVQALKADVREAKAMAEHWQKRTEQTEKERAEFRDEVARLTSKLVYLRDENAAGNLWNMRLRVALEEVRRKDGPGADGSPAGPCYDIADTALREGQTASLCVHNWVYADKDHVIHALICTKCEAIRAPDGRLTS